MRRQATTTLKLLMTSTLVFCLGLATACSIGATSTYVAGRATNAPPLVPGGSPTVTVGPHTPTPTPYPTATESLVGQVFNTPVPIRPTPTPIRPTPTATNPPAPNPTYYDDQDSPGAQITWSGSGWLHSAPGENYFDGTISNTTEANDSVTIQFTGSRIAFIGTKYFTLGILDFSVADCTTGIASQGGQGNEYLASPGQQFQQIIFDTGKMPSGCYTLTMTCPAQPDPTNPTGDSGCEVDGFEVYGP